MPVFIRMFRMRYAGHDSRESVLNIHVALTQSAPLRPISRADPLPCMLTSLGEPPVQPYLIENIATIGKTYHATVISLSSRGKSAQNELIRRQIYTRRGDWALDEVGTRRNITGEIMPFQTTRRSFLQTTAVGLAAAETAVSQEKRPSPNDKIRFAMIGAGARGFMDAGYVVNAGGTEMVAVADVYEGKLTRAREVFGNDISTTRDYHEVLARKDVDAVLITVPDHLHTDVAIDAFKAGKHVYLEKPMVHKIEEGKAVIDAWKASGKVAQIGSQYTTSVIYRKVAELIKSGAIGKLNMVEGWFDRVGGGSAMNLFVPPDATPANIDWDRFLGRTRKVPFEPARLFQWRSYPEYGGNVGGDLYVHLFGALHVATGALGPIRIFAAGDRLSEEHNGFGQDVLLALADYPETARHPAFNLALRVNLRSGLHRNEQFLRFVGSGGVIKAGSTYVNLNYVDLKRGPEIPPPGYSTLNAFPKAIQEQYLKESGARTLEVPLVPATLLSEPDEIFVPPPGRDHPFYAEQMHMNVFCDAIRKGTPVSQDPIDGLRAGGPAELCFASYQEHRVCKWDPEKMEEA